MATHARRPTTRDRGRVPYRFTADEVLAFSDRLGNAELWDGVLYRIVKEEPHTFAVGQLADALRSVLPRGAFHVREEKSCRLGDDSLPEFDVAVARGPRTSGEDQPPDLSTFPFVAEVCHHTESADYGLKLRRYAEAGLACYWVVNLTRRRVDVFTGPAGVGESAGFARRETYAEGEAVPFGLDGYSATVPVDDLLARDVAG